MIWCDYTLPNILTWANKVYCDNKEIIAFNINDTLVFGLPIMDDLVDTIKIINEKYNYPIFYAAEGQQLSTFLQYFGDQYILEEKPEYFDYVYRQENLASLKGKKLSAKRNHISAFSRLFDWRFEEISKNNIQAVLECADQWYSNKNLDKVLMREKEVLPILLNNPEKYNVSGGAIIVNNKVVAYTYGAPINDKVFDICCEKALPDYSKAYAVINNEFAKQLTDFEYINREDDLGIEGLRKAKMSYHPEFKVKKYFLYYKGV